jgi:hypothetical protein
MTTTENARTVAAAPGAETAKQNDLFSAKHSTQRLIVRKRYQGGHAGA